MAGRLLLVCSAFLALTGAVARGDGTYQSTRDGKTLVWNNRPAPGDIATWSGARDAYGYAHGFGLLIWYTREPRSDKPQLYARYWGRMVDGKLEGPVNVHSKRQTHHAIFIDGSRVTGWTAGTAPSSATTRWSALVAKRTRTNIESAAAENIRQREPESPAAGPAFVQDELRRGKPAESDESIQDLYDERWPKIDIDDSLRLLAFPPRNLRSR